MKEVNVYIRTGEHGRAAVTFPKVGPRGKVDE